MSRVGDSTLGIEVSRDYDDKEKREERREKREERREKTEEKRESELAHVHARRHGLLGIIDTMQRCILFCFSIVAQRPQLYLEEVVNNCTATVLKQGLHFPGIAYS